MDPIGIVVVVGVLAIASVFAWWWKARDGRMRAFPTSASSVTNADNVSADDTDTVAGGRLAELARAPSQSSVTLLQFSAEVCSQCAATRRLLSQVAESHADVTHVEVDVVDEMDVVRDWDIRRTPTTFVIGPEGTVAYRTSGVPREGDLLEAIGALLHAHPAPSDAPQP